MAESGTRVVVAIDGPAGAGKSTVARLLAARLGVAHLDTGATYRLVGLRALEEAVPPDDPVALGELAERVAKACELGADGTLRFGGEPVPDAIRTQSAGEAASRVATVPAVRDALVALQRRLVPAQGAVVEGRDIGTVVLPDAGLKVYLDASPETRANRRGADLGETGPVALEAVRERDERDATRAVAPMRPADGALVIDTTQIEPGQVVDRILAVLPGRARPEEPVAPRSAAAVARRAMPAVRLETGVGAGVLRWMVWGFSLVVLRTVFRFRRRGRRIPGAGAAILAANHRSLLDIPVVAILTTRKVWFMGKEELFRSRWLGAFFTALGGFPVFRGRADRRALNTALALLARGELVVVYPEGTRTPDGRFGRIEDGLAYLALRSGAPVVPIALSGTEGVFPRDRKLPSPVRIRALVGEPITVGGPIEAGVVPRSLVHSATEKLRVKLRAVADELEPAAPDAGL